MRTLIQRLKWNTLSNYGSLFSRMIVGLWTLQILFTGLGPEQYGFWVLIWAIFGYSILLDFGFGSTMQRAVAHWLVDKESLKLQSQYTVILCLYSAFAILIALFTLGTTPFLTYFFHFSNSLESSQFNQVWLIFGLCSAVVFPTGAFGEILRGLGRNDLKNWIQIASQWLQLLGVIWIIENHLGLIILCIWSLGLLGFSNLLQWVIAKALCSDLQFNFQLFHWSKAKELSKFSGWSYLITCSNMVIYKSDQIILGIFMGMNAVGVYQAASRLPFLLDKISTAFQDNLSPEAARMKQAGQAQDLRQLFWYSNRISMVICTLFAIPLAFLSGPILLVWLKISSLETIYLAWTLIFSAWSLIAFRSSANKILLMSGEHQFLAKWSLIEAISNLFLSIILVLKFGLIGVAFGTLLPGCFISFFIILPHSAKFCNIQILTYLKSNLFPLLWIITFQLIFFYWINTFNFDWDFLKIILVFSSSIVITFPAIWIYLDSSERQFILKSLHLKK